jgi:hypothetical protein
MKKNMNSYKKGIRTLLVAGVISLSAGSYAQNASVQADPQLGAIKLLDDNGNILDANDLETGKVIKMQIPVISDNHNHAIPAGSCKIKIGLGSKLELDPAFDVNSAALNNYFSWTSANNSGQVQITGDLVNELPANVTYVNVAFKVKASVLGNSTITANFLITNHQSAAILSDENGSNNAASLAYKVERTASLVAAGEATQPYLYPNPVVDVKKVIIETKQGEFKGSYVITVSDAVGKNIQTGTVVLDGVKRFTYNIGNVVAAGKYILQLRKSGSEKVFIIKFEKL